MDSRAVATEEVVSVGPEVVGGSEEAVEMRVELEAATVAAGTATGVFRLHKRSTRDADRGCTTYQRREHRGESIVQHACAVITGCVHR